MSIDNPIYKSLILSHVKSASKRLGYEFKYIDKNGRLAIVKNGDNEALFGASPLKLWPFNSAISMSITNDKELTYRLLKEKKIHLPNTLVGCYDISRYSHLSNPPTTIYELISNTDLSYPLVVKPNDSKGGEGISILQEGSLIKEAIEIASKFSNNILIQEYIPGRDFRIYSFRTTPLLLMERSTDIVHGDGKLTISDIIKSSKNNPVVNQDSFRISLESFIKKFGDIMLNQHNAKDIFPVSNFTQGGKIINVIDRISDNWIRLCSDIFSIIKVDFFAVDCRIKTDHQQDIYVIEVNSNPGIEMIFEYSKEKGNEIIDYLLRKALSN